ncbi:MAG: hypothetical protein BMS9Abin05_1824 [Rhodothermia bacterium]|nr:MAG: hypothetical protein BMS9Abin05_1824 [Rhodothermia bacterium]
MPDLNDLRLSALIQRFVFLFGIVLVTSSLPGASAQVIPLYDVIYRPPGLKYSVLRGDHFDIIFEQGLREQASETLFVLENTLAGTDTLTGAGFNIFMPVVLNKFTDRANGVVTSFPFKQEIDATASKGRGLSRRFPSWTYLVAPHEAVHAAQADFGDGTGLVGFLRWFSPDFARSLNMFVPPGISEGVAVYRESQLTEGAGRLNHPFFTMQIRAAFENGRGWSLAQMLESPSFTRPFDRFYMGGAHFIKYLVENYGDDVIQRLSRWQFRFPFLGYGANLIYATDTSPSKLSRSFRDWFRENERARIEQLGVQTDGALLSGRKGLVNRRPHWLNDSTLVVFSLGYNLRRGFYRIDVQSGKRKLLANTTITEDATYSLNRDSTTILYSRYERDPFVAVQERANVFFIDLASGEIERHSTWSHAINPVETGSGKVLALRNDLQFNSVVEIDQNGLSKVVLDYGRADFVSLLPRPGTDSLAVLMNVKGHQALFVTSLSRLGEADLLPWIGFEGGSIYDASWSKDGRYLVFTADLDDVQNVYVSDEWTDRMWRVTNVPYGASEGALSPSNRFLAYVEYRDQSFDLRTLPFDLSVALEIDRELARYTEKVPWRSWLVESNDYYAYLEPKPYQGLKYLAPRMMYPTFYLDAPRRKDADARMGFGVGVAMQGTDPLQEWTYYGEGILQRSRLWGELGVQWGGSLFRPSFSYSSRPQTINAIIRDAATTREQRLIRRRRQASFGLRVPVTLVENVFRSSVTGLLSVNFREDQFVDDDFIPRTRKTNRTTLSPALIFGYKVQRNVRDLVSNSGIGIRLFSDIDVAVNGGSLKRALIGLGDLYLPFFAKFNTGLHINTGVVVQNSPSVFNLDFFKPRGREDILIPKGTSYRYGITVTQPILFIDDGLFLLPVFFKAAYVYGFADRVLTTGPDSDDYSSLGFGLGLRLRLFYTFDFDLRLEAAYLPEKKSWDTAYWINSTRY